MTPLNTGRGTSIPGRGLRKSKVVRSVYLLVAGLLCALCPVSFAELQTTLSLSAPVLTPGGSGPFTATQISGPAASTTSTLSNPYAGVLQYILSAGTGRFASLSGTRYGIQFDTFQIFQSFLSTNFFTVVNSATTCPSMGSYTWLLSRYRSPDAPRLPMDATSTSTFVGGTLNYDPLASPVFSSSTTFDLVGPNVYSNPYSFDVGPYGACSSGQVKLVAAAEPPLDTLGRVFFGPTFSAYVGWGGNPQVAILMPQQTLTPAIMSNLGRNVLSGLFTGFTSKTTQKQKNVYVVPNAAGTTFTLNAITNFSDPTQSTFYGQITCTSLNAPVSGFCRGTLTLSGVAGSSNAICQLGSTTSQDMLNCTFDMPDQPAAGGSLIATRSTTSLLSVTVPGTAASTAPTTSTGIVATVQNLTGSYVPTMGDPSVPAQQLQPPFSDPGAYLATGSTCGSTLKGYASCTVNLTYNPPTVGTTMQNFRVAYNNQASTVNATTAVIGTSGLVSLAITPNSSSFANGTTQQFTATATYSDGSTQDVSNAVLWNSNAANVASVSSTGNGSFLTVGAFTLSASLAGISTSFNANVYVVPPNPTGLSATPNSYSQITLNWTSGGGSTSAFQIAYQAGATAPADCNSGTVVSSGVVGAATSYAVTSLFPSTLYAFRVCAVNSTAGQLSAGVTTTATTVAPQSIFSTSGTYQGNMGGLYFSDFACQVEALNAGLTGTWRAILSDGSTSAASRISLTQTVYNQRPIVSGGRQIVATSAAFWSGTFSNAVAYNAGGGSPGATNAWSGSTSAGAINAGKVCSNWTTSSSAVNGEYGQNTAINTNVFANNFGSCGALNSLYCIDTQTPAVAPPDPTSFSTYTTGSSAIAFTWTSGGGTTAAYKIAYQTGATAPASCNVGTVISAATLGLNPTSYTVSSLTASTQYSFRLCALNSDLSASSAGTTLTVTTTASGTSTNLGSKQVVFSTSAQYPGNFGGIYFADYLCQSEAASASLTGVWKAILSDDSTTALSRISMPGTVYNNRPFGSGGIQIVAPDSSSFWNSSLSFALNYTAGGSTPPSGSVWTGSTTAGAINVGRTCTNWTTAASGGPTGEVGTNTATGNFVATGNPACNTTATLYCTNQQSASVAPPNPTSFATYVTGNNFISFTWATGGGTTAAYQMSYQTGASAPASCTAGTVIPASTLGNNPSGYTLNGLSASTQYSFRLCAENSDLSAASSGTTLTVTTLAAGQSPIVNFGTKQVIFSTSAIYQGSIGGLYYADFACQKEALTAGIPGVWKALMGDESTSAFSRISIAGNVYNNRSYASGGIQLEAPDSSSFWSGALPYPLQYSIAGTTPGSSVAWTGSTVAGALGTGLTCTNWTTANPAVRGIYGNNTSGNEINNGNNPCSNTYGIYCTNQQTAAAAPPNPASFVAGTVANNSITFNWTAGGGTTSAYQLAYQTGAVAPATCNAGTVISATSLGVNPTSKIVTGLTPSTQYSFRLCAENSDLSLASSGTTLTVTTQAANQAPVVNLGTKQVVFATASTYQGNFGGINYSDFACQTEANAAGITGIWKAITSDESTSAISRILVPGAVYNNRASSAGGSQLAASDAATFWGSAVAASLQYTATGAANATGVQWTGTTNAGATNAGFTCSSWTTTNPATRGQYGNSAGSTPISGGNNPCNSSYTFFCTNQQTSSAAPPNPASFATYIVADNSISFNWATGGGSTAAFQLAYQTGGTAPATCNAGTVISAATLGVNPTSYAVTGLTPSTQYSFRLCAENSDLTSASSGLTVTVTTQALNQSPVTNLGSRQVVFTTTTPYRGNFGGIYFGDYACQYEATNASLTGVWKAILSDESTSAFSRINIPGSVYNFRPTSAGGNQKVASDSAGFWGSALTYPLNYSATGSTPGNTNTWTGTTAAGAINPGFTCSSWTTQATTQNGMYGGNTGTGNEIGSNNNANCANTYPLYCTNQQTAAAAPADPATFTTYSVGPTTIGFNFTSGGGTTAAYQLAYRTGAIAPLTCNSNTVVPASLLGINPTSYTLNGLTASTQYSFRLCAENSDLSVASTGLTLTVTTPAAGSAATVNYGTTQIIFSTQSSTNNAAFGGINFGDFICQKEAWNAGISGTWKAILSDDTTSAVSRLTIAPYIYNNRPVASGGIQQLATSSSFWTALFPYAPNYTATGAAPTITNSWTGSTFAGAIKAGLTCSGWTSSSGAASGEYGANGNVASTSVFDNAATGCNNTNISLLCLNQQSSSATPPNPTGFSQTAITQSSIAFSWASGGGTTAAYQLAYQSGAVAPVSCKVGTIVPATVLGVNPVAYTLTGLNPGTQYSFRLCAENSDLTAESAGPTLSVTTSAVAATANQTIFATTTLYRPTFGGVNFADYVCQTEAIAGGLSGTWKALLSDASTSAASRLSLAATLYNNRPTGSGGPQAFATSAAFWSSTFSNSIRYNAAGGTPGNTPTWTGSTAAGLIQTNQHCNGWTTNSSSFTAEYGNNNQTTATNAFAAATTGCNNAWTLYCLNQQTSPAAPANPTAFTTYETTTNSVGFTWASGGGTTAAYQLSYQTGGTAPATCTAGTVIPAATLGFNPNTYTIGGLNAGTQYSFRLCAANSDVSAFSSGVTATVTTVSTGSPATYAFGANQFVFVTSALYGSNFGGINYGDFACQLEAGSAGLPGVWKAILSDTGNAASTRLTVSGNIFNLRASSAGGSQKVSDSTNFWNSLAYNPITYTAVGLAPNSVNAWTGTNAVGTSSTNTCADWTSSSSALSGQYGTTNSTTAYISQGIRACNNTGPLYCLNQQAASAAPPNPATFTAFQTTSSSVSLAWSSGGGSTAAFQIAYQTGASAPANCTAGTVIAAAVLGVNPSTATVTGLNPSTQYSFRLCAENSDLSSASSGLTTTMTTLANGGGTSFALGTNQFMFATSASFQGQLGSIYFADYSCQTEAAAAGLDGIWKSVLSDSSNNASTRISVSSNIYNFRSPSSGGTQKITDGPNLWTSLAQNTTNYTPYGVAPANTAVWTGSTGAGTVAATTCSDWTVASSATNGTFGRNNNLGALISNGTTACNGSYPLYCINQQTASSTPPNPAALNVSQVSNSSVSLNFSSGGGTTAAYQIAYQTGATAPATCSVGTVVSPTLIGNNPGTYTVTSLSASTQYSFRLCARNSDLSATSAGLTATATTQAGPPATNTLGTDQYIFVTNAGYGAGFGGLYYGDFICQNEAAAAGVSGVWKAVLSDSVTAANSRISLAGNVYNFRPAASGGIQKVTDSSNFWNNSFYNPITYTAFGAAPPNTAVWTGSTAAGASNANTCTDWTTVSSTVNASYGRSNQASSQFANNNTNCSGTFPLYCINQQTAAAAPPDPASFTTFLLGPTSLGFSFASAGGTTAGFQMSYQTGAVAPATCNSGTVVPAATLGVNPTSYTVTGLASSTQYSFRLCAVNSDVSALSTGRTTSATTLTSSASPIQTLGGLQLVFATSTAYDGVFGGLYFGDFACQTEANGAGLSGTWRAILADEATDASSHITLVPPMYNTQSAAAGGIQQISNGTGFYSGPWTNNANFTAAGAVPGSTRAWTGTLGTGLLSAGNTCNSWTTYTSAVNGRYGGTTSPANGASLGNAGCNNFYSLYCISQQSSAAAPPDPATFTSYAVSTTSIGFNWSSGGGTTAAYQLAYQTGGTAPASCTAGTVISATTLGVAPTTFTVTGLSPSTQYSFRLCAENSDLTLASAGRTMTRTTPSAGTMYNLGTSQYIFSTAALYYPNFGGVNYADYICQSEANTNGVPGIWKALLSDSVTSASTRLSVSGPLYNLRPGSSGGSQQISDSSSFFSNTTMAAPFPYTASGATPAQAFGWTGSTSTGTPTANLCSDWTTTNSAQSGTVGRNSVTSTYINNTTGACNTNRTLFCLNQQTASATPPDPTAFSNYLSGSTYVGFTWTSGGGSTAAYQMSYQTGGTAPATCNAGTVVSAATLGVNPTSYTVTGLSASTQYSFRLCAENSDLSAASTGVTLTVTTPASGVQFFPGSNQFIFSTATAYSPNFGSIYWGDYVCQKEAATAGLSGTWKALLGDDTTAATSHVTLSTNIYNLRLPTSGGAQQVATSSYFYSGVLQAPLNYTASGGPPGATRSWTGATAAGALNAGRTCTNWTSNSGGVTAAYGSNPSTSGEINSGNNACNVNYSLYCLNQQTPTAAPPDPTGFTNGAITTSSVVLNWTSGGGTTGGFQIAYQLGAVAPNNCSTGTVISAATIGTNPATFTVTGLSSATQYSFRLCGENSDASLASAGVTRSVTTN